MRGTSPPAFFLFGAVVLASLTLGLLGPINALRAQAPTGPDTTESTTEDSTGIVTGVTWRTITVDSRRGPFTYRLGQDLHINGPDNHPLKITEVYPGDKATVFYYIRDGQQTVGRMVVLRRSRPTRK